MLNNTMSLKRAAFINAVSKYAIVIWNLVVTAVLARLLTAEDYGVVAVATIFTKFFSMFSDMGISTGIIQNKTLTDKEINGIYLNTMFLAIGLFALCSLFGMPVSVFYNNTAYQKIFAGLAIGLFFSTLNIVPNSLLMKNKLFKLVAVRNFITTMVSSGLAIYCAYKGYSYYSLILQSVLFSFLLFVWNYITCRNKYRLHFESNGTGISKIWKYSLFQFGFSSINYFSRNLDNLLISKIFGEAALGYYDKAYLLTTYPTSNITNVITPVLHPVLSEHQNEKNLIYQTYIKIIRFLSALALIIAPVCFCSSDEIIVLLFGEKWLPSAIYFMILSTTIWSQMITSSVGAIFQSTGNTKSLFKVGIINTMITLTAIFSGILLKSMLAFCICIAIAFNIHFLTSFYYLMKEAFQLDFNQLLKELYPDLIILMILFSVAAYLRYTVMQLVGLFALIAKSSVIFIVYVILIVVTKRYTIFKIILKRKK